MTKLASITPRQQEIVHLLYSYRFLGRAQLQLFLTQKDRRRLVSWLKDLREKRYIDWHYDSTSFIGKSTPAVYYLSLGGIRYLRSLAMYPDHELRKRYKEPKKTPAFITQCLLMADCCLTLQAESRHGIRYTRVLPSEYSDSGSKYHFLDEIKPHLFFVKREKKNTISYLLESIQPTLPRYQLRKRLKDYGEYLVDWDKSNGPVPKALFICSTKADLAYVKRRLKKVLDEEWAGEEVSVSVTTLEEVHSDGVTSSIWEGV